MENFMSRLACKVKTKSEEIDSTVTAFHPTKLAKEALLSRVHRHPLNVASL